RPDRPPGGPARAAPARGEEGRVPRRARARRRGRAAARGRRARRLHPALPAGGRSRAMNEVAILGVGMIRFGLYPSRSPYEMACEAGNLALDDAGLTFRDVDAVYAGQIFHPAMTAVRAVKELGLTGVPIQRIENASATGSCALLLDYPPVAHPPHP